MIDFNAIDDHVGHSIKTKRALLGLSQTQLAKALGVSFQQVQKYENGKNRISASKLFVTANLFDVEPNYFFGGIMTVQGQEDALATIRPLTPTDVSERETLRAMRAYGSIGSEANRKAMRNLMRAIGEAE